MTAVFEQVDLVHRMIAAYPGRFRLALTADDVDAAFAAGQIASLLGAEGGHCINGSLGVLRVPVRARRPLHDADPQRQRRLGRLRDRRAGHAAACRDFGREVVAEMQRLGMLVDLSHVAGLHDERRPGRGAGPR